VREKDQKLHCKRRLSCGGSLVVAVENVQRHDQVPRAVRLSIPQFAGPRSSTKTQSENGSSGARSYARACIIFHVQPASSEPNKMTEARVIGPGFRERRESGARRGSHDPGD
jgi:hypothetical protein